MREVLARGRRRRWLALSSEDIRRRLGRHGRRRVSSLLQVLQMLMGKELFHVLLWVQAGNLPEYTLLELDLFALDGSQGIG
jgi:hypothetical protein